MTPYRPAGRTIWSVKVPRETGGWGTISTGTRDARTAKRMQEMIDALGRQGARAWDVLEQLRGADAVSLGALYDRWIAAGKDVERLRESLRTIDLAPLVETYLAAATCAPDTKAHYRVHLRGLIPAERPYPATHFTRAAIQRYLDSLTVASGTKRKAAAAIRVFANWCVTRDVLRANPVAGLRLPKAAAPRTLYLDPADAQRLADAQPSPFREFSALLAGSGIDVSVALRLRRRDVDVTNREIRAAGTKAHTRDRVARVADWAWPYVEQAIAGLLPDARLFAGISNRWRARDVHAEAIETLSPESPVFAGYTMRDARHTYAVRAIRAGAPPELVAQQLGHANATLVLTVYGRFRPDQHERSRWEQIATAHDAARVTETLSRR